MQRCPQRSPRKNGGKELTFHMFFSKQMQSSSEVRCFLDFKNHTLFIGIVLQWITLVRKHEKIVVADNTVFPVFKRHCKRAVVQKERDCIPDEHYMQTLLSMGELEDELERRTLTYTSWNQSNMGKGKQSWHPSTFHYGNASLQHIKEIKDISHVYYETELRTEWCRSTSTSIPCFLFARKFSCGGDMRLLTEGVVGPYDASSPLLPSSTSQSDRFIFTASFGNGLFDIT